jgi:hypothetical protein
MNRRNFLLAAVVAPVVAVVPALATEEEPALKVIWRCALANPQSPMVNTARTRVRMFELQVGDRFITDYDPGVIYTAITSPRLIDFRGRKVWQIKTESKPGDHP